MKRAMRKKRFTLIEMIVVMAIMGALMTMMLPSFNKMINGNKVDQMASNIKLGLEQAQSHAITSRRYVAIIFPNKKSSWISGTLDLRNYCLGGYRLAYVKYDSNNRAWNFVRWLDGSMWKNEPSGAMLVRMLPKATAYNLKDSPWTTGVPDACTDANATLGDSNLLLDVRSLPTLGNVSNCAIIFSPYGGIENDELGLVVAEGLIDGNTITYINKVGSNPANYLVLRVSKFSGRVDYR